MITVNIRKQGGAAIMTIPSDVLKMLKAEVGTTLKLEVNGDAFTATPLHKVHRKRYTLTELLQDVTPENMDELNADIAWMHEGEPFGREL